jgi:hypothetical protein
MLQYTRCPKCSGQVPEGARFCQRCGATQGPKGRGTPGKASTGLRTSAFVIALVTIALVVTGSVVGIQRMRNHQAETANMPGATAALTIEGAGPMPAWLVKADKSVANDYVWAASHHDELQYFPCFCGCYNSAGHTSNSECYFQRNKGQITAYDQHAYG